MDFGNITRQKVSDALAGGLTYQRIADNAGVSIRWLFKFMARESDTASLKHVQQLHDSLGKKKRAQ